MTNKNVTTAVCIIGSGPAGATTSLFLSKSKVPHVIVDAAVFPRDKICGDGLDLKVMRVLNQLDPALVENEVMNNPNFIKAWGCSIIVSEHKKSQVNFTPSSDYPFFFTCKRAYFDNFLVSKINPEYATFLQETKVKEVVRENGMWRITAQKGAEQVEICANLVVGADGDHSAVLRSLGERKIERQHYAGALRQYWKGVSDMNTNNHLEIYLPKSLPLGYLWIFPLPNGEANVGCGLVSEQIAKRSVDLKKMFHYLTTEDPAIAPRFRHAQPLEKPAGWGLPYASQRRKASGDGYLLTGDAAGLICPVTGEGIGPAMMSGLIAAQFIERAVKQQKFDETMFANYDREITKRLQGDIKKYNFVRKVNPSLYNFLINFLTATGVAQYYCDKRIKRWITTAKTKLVEVEM